MGPRKVACGKQKYPLLIGISQCPLSCRQFPRKLLLCCDNASNLFTCPLLKKGSRPSGKYNQGGNTRQEKGIVLVTFRIICLRRA